MTVDHAPRIAPTLPIAIRQRDGLKSITSHPANNVRKYFCHMVCKAGGGSEKYNGKIRENAGWLEPEAEKMFYRDLLRHRDDDDDNDLFTLNWGGGVVEKSTKVRYRVRHHIHTHTHTHTHTHILHTTTTIMIITIPNLSPHHDLFPGSKLQGTESYSRRNLLLLPYTLYPTLPPYLLILSFILTQ